MYTEFISSEGLIRMARKSKMKLDIFEYERPTGLEFNNSEWRLQGDVMIKVPGGNLQSSEARVMFRNNAIASVPGGPGRA